MSCAPSAGEGGADDAAGTARAGSSAGSNGSLVSAPGRGEAEPARYAFLRRWTSGWPLRCGVEDATTIEPGRPALGVALAQAVQSWNGCLPPGSDEVLSVDPDASADTTLGVQVGWRTGAHGEQGACQAFEGGEHLAHTVATKNGFEVHVDSGREWSAESLLHTVAHELGHALGLAHSDDPRALMHPSLEEGGSVPTTSDRDGLRSLYAFGNPEDGDLVLRGPRRDEPRLLLAGWGEQSVFAWDVLDTDGDGDDEVLVWRTDEVGYGVLRIVHFEASSRGPLPQRSLGPLPGVAVPGREHLVGQTVGGQAVFVSLLEGRRYLVRRFDERGLPVPREPAPLALDTAAGSWRDEDGDGVWEVAPEAVGFGEVRHADLDGDGVLEEIGAAN